jgi:hypothetical protein
MPVSYVNPEYVFTKDDWYIHILNTEGTRGHSVIVIEGMKPATPAFLENKGRVRLEEFVGQYEMSHKVLDEKRKNLGINRRGYFDRINVFEPGMTSIPTSIAYLLYERRDYGQYPSRTIPISYVQAQLIIASIKADQSQCDDARASGRVEDFPLYQALGNGHWLIELFGDNNDGHNCASWCIEKLKAGGINLDTLFPKPKVLSCTIL